MACYIMTSMNQLNTSQVGGFSGVINNKPTYKSLR